VAAADRTLAFVPPRYGDDVVGGSEAVMREAARGLAARGWNVDVVTTCARDHYTWANDYPAGPADDDGLRVWRFPIVREGGSPIDRGLLEQRIASGAALSDEEQQWWLNGLFRVPDLFHHLVAHAERYRAIVFSPYLFWTTVAGLAVAPDRSIITPCLHDEPYARMGVFQAVLPTATRAWYGTEPERDLAIRLGLSPADHDTVGFGVHVPDAYDPDKARERYGLERPFLFYAGRREGGKGWTELLMAYEEAAGRGVELDLVTIGVGDPQVPDRLAHRVHDLGFLPADETHHLFAAATAYVQPSRNESFSRTVMEAWLAGTPVLANGASDVVRWHCERSQAGVVWHGPGELVAAIEVTAAGAEAMSTLALLGRQYVLAHYTWPLVLDRMEASLERMPWPG
jgi:glycosyltransferase involved in cell wall biosynthesis